MMHPDFHIVSVFNDKAERVIDLILPIQQIEFNVPVTIDDQPDLLDIDAFYHRPGGGFWGVTHQGEIVGTIALISIGHGAGAIRKMFVKKEFRGKEYGIAAALLTTLFAYAKKHAINEIYLGTVPVLLAAQRFYERNGFEKIAKSDLPPYFPRMHADEIFYHISLNAG